MKFLEFPGIIFGRCPNSEMFYQLLTKLVSQLLLLRFRGEISSLKTGLWMHVEKQKHYQSPLVIMRTKLHST
jgi:hypothetical protein